MVKIVTAIRSHRYFAIMATLVVLSGVVFGISRRTRHQDLAQSSPAPTITNRTTALRVLGVEKVLTGNISVLVIKLQNVSDKDIKALTISAGRTWVTKNYLLGEESIAAGSIVNQRISLSADTAEVGNAKPAAGLTIAAALFVDGTGDGDSRYVKILSDQHAGIRAQAKRVQTKLQRLSMGPQQEQSLTDLETEINTLPTKGNGPASPDYDDGLEKARSTLLTRLSEIKEHRRAMRFDEAAKSQQRLQKVFAALAGSPLN